MAVANCVFAWGAGECFFFESQKIWRTKWDKLPTGVNRYFTCNDAWKVGHVYNLVFGANGSYMMTWRGKNGINYEVNHGLPSGLTAWLNQKNAKGNSIRDVPNLRLTISGANNESWFISDGKNYLWNGLPKGLDEAIEKLRKKGGGFVHSPRIVALGKDHSYMMITSGGGGSWSVKTAYPSLDVYINGLVAAKNGQGGALANINYVSLDAFDGEHFVITTKSAGYQARAPTDWLPLLNEVLATLSPVSTAGSRGAVTNGQRGSTSSNIMGVLKLANTVLKTVNAVNGNGGGGGGGGGGGYNGGFDTTQANMDFTSSLQNSTWSSVDNAANWNVQ